MNSSSSIQPATSGPCSPPRNITRGLTTRNATIVSLYQSRAWPGILRAKADARALGISRLSRLAADFRFSLSPHRLAATDLVDHFQDALVRRQLVVTGTHDSQHTAWPRSGRGLVRNTDVELRDLAENQRRLAAGHGQIDVEQDLRIEQCAVQLAMRVVDAVALAQRIKAVALTRMHLPRQRQRVDHRAELAHAPRGARQTLQLRVEERDVERGVVNHQ